jgi:hypothetical protein
MDALLGKQHDHAVSIALNLSQTSIYNRRKQLSIKPFEGSYTTKYDWSKVDWLKSNQEIANLLGCTTKAVEYQRRQR